MPYIRPIPVKNENIDIGKQYYTCNYTGAIVITVLKKFTDTNSVLVKINNKKCKPFVRSMNYIFDNQPMARSAGHDWEHYERKRNQEKRKKRKMEKQKIKEN